MSLKDKMVVLATVCMFVLNSCRWADVPVQECYPPDTTGVKSSVEEWSFPESAYLVWDDGFGLEECDVTVEIEAYTTDAMIEWDTIDNTLDADTHWTIAVVVEELPPYSVAIEELLELYKEYETECWNDSTFIYYGEFSVVGDSVVTNTWVHSKPRFKGFMEYLSGLQMNR